MMTERDMVSMLVSMLEGESLEDSCPDGDVDVSRLSVSTFEEHGLLTRNQGVVLRLGDSEFQLTVVRSR